MIVDDLGTEPREVMEFGNVYTPLIDLITTRYEEQLYTIFTTNLTPAQLEEKYGKRIVDRLNEMVEKVVFENESYRRWCFSLPLVINEVFNSIFWSVLTIQQAELIVVV